MLNEPKYAYRNLTDGTIVFVPEEIVVRPVPGSVWRSRRKPRTKVTVTLVVGEFYSKDLGHRPSVIVSAGLDLAGVPHVLAHTLRDFLSVYEPSDKESRFELELHIADYNEKTEAQQNFTQGIADESLSRGDPVTRVQPNEADFDY